MRPDGLLGLFLSHPERSEGTRIRDSSLRRLRSRMTEKIAPAQNDRKGRNSEPGFFPFEYSGLRLNHSNFRSRMTERKKKDRDSSLRRLRSRMTQKIAPAQNDRKKEER